VTNLQVNISTTSKKADELRPVFAENVGPDETVAFVGTNYIPTGHWGLPTCPRPPGYGNPIILDVPFYFNPTYGNLMLELRVSGVQPYPGPPWQVPSWWTDGGLPYNKLDAQTLPGDSISRAAAFSLTTNTAEVVETSGLVTIFNFATTPALTNHYETNTLTLSWAAQPQTFRLQWADTLGEPGAWSDYPGTIGGGALYRIVTITSDMLQRSKFLRLHWNTPQPLPAQGAKAQILMKISNNE
jgi:hypothetical protein